MSVKPKRVSSFTYALSIWLKQHVEIKHFYEMTKNALQNQIYIAFITYCLHVLIRLEAKSKKSLLRISRWLKAALWKPAYIWLRRFKRKVET